MNQIIINATIIDASFDNYIPQHEMILDVPEDCGDISEFAMDAISEAIAAEYTGEDVKFRWHWRFCQPGKLMQRLSLDA